MTRLYGYHQAETIAYRALLDRFGWADVSQYRKWEWPHAILAMDARPEHEVLSIGAHGCGVTVALVGKVKHLVAVDPHSQFKRWAEERLPRAQCIQRDARDLHCLSDGAFDRIVSTSVLEHVRPPRDGDIDVAREIGRLLRPGGLVVLTLEVAREWVKWQPPVGRLYDLEHIMSRIVEPSGLKLVGGEGLDWDSGDWDHVWPDVARQGMPDLIPAALVLRKASG